ncbi:hypothetical protein SAMN05519103_07292 [Rhizobiales bacterium GAS113]|nr:hypothetical protein SAMN05519103_07292 [Rhizobiales bacterium GAS113]
MSLALGAMGIFGLFVGLAADEAWLTWPTHSTDGNIGRRLAVEFATLVGVATAAVVCVALWAIAACQVMIAAFLARHGWRDARRPDLFWHLARESTVFVTIAFMGLGGLLVGPLVAGIAGGNVNGGLYPHHIGPMVAVFAIAGLYRIAVKRIAATQGLFERGVTDWRASLALRLPIVLLIAWLVLYFVAFVALLDDCCMSN